MVTLLQHSKDKISQGECGVHEEVRKGQEEGRHVKASSMGNRYAGSLDEVESCGKAQANGITVVIYFYHSIY